MTVYTTMPGGDAGHSQAAASPRGAKVCQTCSIEIAREAPSLAQPTPGAAKARTDAAIAASACDDTLTTTLGYVQRRVALRDITNHV